jgi:hypothetical protein
MARPQDFNLLPEASSSGSPAGAWKVPRPVKQVQMTLVHELGADLRGGTAEGVLWVEPSNRPTRVTVKSELVTQGVQALRSPEYMATVRRRQARSLAVAVMALEPHADREDFVTCTFPMLKQINGLLNTLRDAEQEGNTREILRELRSSIMNGGWNKYRSPKVRAMAVAILEHLAEAAEVSAKNAHAVFDKLHTLGLDPVGAPVFDSDEGTDDADGQKG